MEEETAKKAAKWWSDHLRSNAKLDNGDTSVTGMMTLVASHMLQEIEHGKRTPEQIDAFEGALTSAFMALPGNRPFSCGVDYDPDLFLSNAAASVGLDLGKASLPWKSGMSICGNVIEVRIGYGSQPYTI